jgi:membrane-bound ClpP family serine protease
MRTVLFVALAFLGAAAPGLGLSQENGTGEKTAQPLALVATIDGAIGPATASMLPINLPKRSS